MPHWQQENVWYFITFRLADSIPAHVIKEIKLDRELWLKKHQKGHNNNFTKEELKEYYRLFSERVEILLNAGMGSCVLKDKKIAKIVADALLYFNNQRYVLDEWVVMPNHVHVLVKPLGEYNLTDILHSWKSFTANEINKVIGNNGQLWMHESYDHIVRNERALEAIRNYIRQNPVKAGIKVTEASLLQIVHESRDASDTSLLPDKIESRDASDTSLLPIESESRDAFGTSGTFEQQLRNLLSYSDKEITFTAAEKEKLIHAIDTIKILDPACGSGAFPMGILHKLVHVLHKLDPKNQLWKQRQIEKAEAIDDAPSREAAIEAIEEAFENNELDYGRKLYLIENCIFGVDIQPVAVQISKLRFFISLIVEQKVFPASSGKKNLGVRPLPNLETKFVAANTLIALEKENANLFTNPEIDKAKEQLKKIRHDYFEARTPKRKESCRAKDKELRNHLAELLVTNHDLQPATAKKVATWNPYDQNASAPFFDMEWMFGFNDGFDVVIGNPPYKVESKSDQIDYKEYSTKNCGDLYAYFIEQSLKCFLKTNGTLSFITASLFIKGLKFISLRNYLEKNLKIISLEVQGDNIFENVQMPTAVIIGLKSDKINNNWSFENFIPNNSIIKSIENNTNPLSQISGVMRGFEIGRDQVFNHGEIKFITGSDVNKFGIIKYSFISKDILNEYKKKEDYFTGERILIRETGSKLTVLFLDFKLYCNRSLYSIKVRDKKYSTKYLAALLNSSLIQFYYQSKFKSETELFPKIRIIQVNQLPIKYSTYQNQFDFIVDKILTAKEENPQADTSALEMQIDIMVYKLYQLTYEEVLVIDKDFINQMSKEEYDALDFAFEYTKTT